MKRTDSVRGKRERKRKREDGGKPGKTDEISARMTQKRIFEEERRREEKRREKKREERRKRKESYGMMVSGDAILADRLLVLGSRRDWSPHDIYTDPW